MSRDAPRPMRIKLSDERRADLAEMLQRFFSSELDCEVSDFQADRIIDFFVLRLGAPIYNQAIQDARAFFDEKLHDLDGELYEPEERD